MRQGVRRDHKSHYTDTLGGPFEQIHKICVSLMHQTLVSELLSSSEGLSGFPNYQRLKKFCCNFKVYNVHDLQIQLDTNLKPI